ncbi:YqgE/AlgH family protein [Aliiroseovarius sp. PTFE2010]|uniref:YqgE/AlgH family protein n=1 Tax=Aliiroseovarius sp. PTFE2010 TaxID=3417190 RepID=UPI003CFB3721
MNQTDDPIDLTGKLLIAMPGMSDARFEKSVVYLCAHSSEGAMGLIVNKPLPDLSLSALLDQLEIDAQTGAPEWPVFFGGPVEHGRGFVLHSSDYQSKGSTLRVTDSFSMTATRGILSDIAAGAGPAMAILALGYSGWGPGQLEAEIAQNGWLSCDASPEVVFARDSTRKWEAALRILGIEPLLLSAEAGRA